MWRTYVMDKRDGHMWRTNVTDRCDGHTWQTVVTDRRYGQMWWTDVTNRHDGQMWRTDMMDRSDVRTWWTDVMDRCDRQTCWTDITDRCDKQVADGHDIRNMMDGLDRWTHETDGREGWMWWMDLTDRHDRPAWRTDMTEDVTEEKRHEMVRKHCSRAGCRACAAMNLNHPDCQTTNQMTFTGTHPITGEKLSSFWKKSLDMLRKTTFCSHFLQHLRMKNSWLFVFTLLCANGNPYW